MSVPAPMTYPEAIVVGLIQGVTELFPLSSLGHNVLIPAVVGGQWAADLNVSAPESPYLAYIVGLHVATALAMIIYFWRDWVRIVTAFFRSLRLLARGGPGEFDANEKLAWMIILATIPVGIAGLALEHLFRTTFAKPLMTAAMLFVNGLVLFGGEILRRRNAPAADRQEVADRVEVAAASGPGTLGPRAGRHSSGQRAVKQAEADLAVQSDRRIVSIGYGNGILLGAMQIFALFPGISRDGIVMVSGMVRGMTRQDAARFSFLLSAPVILAAGVLKIPDLFGPLGHGIHGQVLAGSIVSFIGAYAALRFFMRYISDSTRTLAPFAAYCLIAGAGAFIYLSVK
jgi:undecaprenyl-diphosphatase